LRFALQAKHPFEAGAALARSVKYQSEAGSRDANGLAAQKQVERSHTAPPADNHASGVTAAASSASPMQFNGTMLIGQPALAALTHRLGWRGAWPWPGTQSELLAPHADGLARR
jgi:hypothetical protein